jgi:hypothetical protein
MSKQHILVSIALVAMLGVVGCSESNKTTAPVGDTVAPAAVVDLDGYGVDGSSPTINLSWKAGPELDLAGYHIYRSVDGGTAEFVGTTTQSRWTDRSVYKNTRYVYEVSAFDQTNNEGTRSATAPLRIDGYVNAHQYDIN